MLKKPLDVSNMEEAKEKVSDIKVTGDPGAWICICKASSEKQGWMKSTKAMPLCTGSLIQVTTQQTNWDGSYALSESLTFVPGVWFIQISDGTWHPTTTRHYNSD